VLPDAFVSDPERLARFRREAQVLASLNHPNIAHVYGLEQSDGVQALVMELVEGPTLADRIAQGPVPVEEALPIAKQIAEALEAAHEQNIIHRDLKPANIKLRPDATVKVLDFGLAKVLDSTAAATDTSHSPTITSPAMMTGVGVLLGTAAYMSPEQARGGQVDKRADIWAFGVVLYEMLAGRRLFDEATVSDTLAGVLKSDVKLDALPREVPSSVRRLIGRCLTRDLRRRLRDVGEARIALEDAIAHDDAAADSVPSDRASTWSAWRKALPWVITASAVVAAGIIVWTTGRQPPRSEPVMRLSSDMGAGIRLNATMGSRLVLSPDGRVLVLVGSPGVNDRSRLFVRHLDQLQATSLPGTEGARNPFFSPDGQSIGFFADGQLKRVPLSGGTAVALCDAPDDRGGSWSDDGWIVFSPRPGEALYRVSSEGGTPEALTTLGAREVTHRWPQVLPGGRAVLYTASTATGNYEAATIAVRSLASGETTIVHRSGYNARYVPSGHLVYISQGSLYAARFNLDRLAIESPAAPIVGDVTNAPGTGAADFSISSNGSMVYAPSAGEAENPSIFWLSADGKLRPLRSVPATYQTIRFAPDGERLATTIRNQQTDIWTYEWGRDVMSPVTSHPALDTDPVWSPDGSGIAFRSTRSGVDNLYWQHSDGTGEPVRLTDSKIGQQPKSWHPSGRFVAYEEVGRDRDVWIMPIEGDEASGWRPGKPSAFLSGSFNEGEPAFSPDGRWLAYASDESGTTEVFVVPFPGPGGRSRVSTAGGSFPRWSAAQRELFYLGEDRKIMVAAFTVQGTTFRADKPRVWSDVTVVNFDVHPDGKRVAVLKAPESRTQQQSGDLVFIVNFFDELRRLTR
jgi:serine/threonine protein kinase/Tol biopolymer transport system component